MSSTVIVGSGIIGRGLPDTDPASVLGQRGLRYKDEATRLGMAAVELALRDAGVSDCAEQITGVVASSNFGNLDTVCKIVGDGTAPGERGAMDLPNASSNVVASSIAIRFGLFGPNMMLCNGANSGLDALRCAELLLMARRAARIVVVGVEVSNPVVARFATPRQPFGYFHGAACVILEPSDTVSTVPLAAVRATARGESFSKLARNADVQRWYTPDSGVDDEISICVPNAEIVDLAARYGSASGALGVLQAASAVCAGGRSLLTTGGGDEPRTACLIESVR